MHNKSYKKAVVFAICLTMLMPLGSMVVSSTDQSSSQADSSAAAVSIQRLMIQAQLTLPTQQLLPTKAAIRLLKTQQPMRKQLLQQARTTRFSL